MDFLEDLGRWVAVSAALAIILFASTVELPAESDDFSFSAFAKPQTPKGFSGTTSLETWYEPLVYGYTEPGQPWDSSKEPSVHFAPTLQADWAASGIVRNESSYAFITLKAPDAQQASTIMPVWLNDDGVPIPQTEVSVAPSDTFRDPIRYSAVLAHPTLDRGFYADENSPWIDEVSLDASTTGTLEVTARFDFSPEFADGGFSDVSAVDAAGGFGYLAAEEIAAIAVLEFDGASSERRGAVYLADGARGIGGMAVNEIDGRLYVSTQNPPGIQVFARPGSSGIPNYLYSVKLPEEFYLVPAAVIVDSRRGLLYVASLPADQTEGEWDTSFQIAKLRIEGDSLVATPRAVTLFAGGEAFVYDPIHALFYTAVRQGSRYYFHRIHAGVGDNAPYFTDWKSTAFTFPAYTSRDTSMPIGLLRDNGNDAYFIGRDQGFTSRIHKVELFPSQVLPDTIYGTKLAFRSDYRVPVPYTRITSVNMYTHTAGAKIRLALYRNNFPSAEDSLLWQSPEMDSVEEGWISVPISAGSVPEVEIGANKPVWIAFHSNELDFKPSFVTFGNSGDGFTGGYGAGEFLSAVQPYTGERQQFAVYFTHQEASVARMELIPFQEAAAPGYTRDRRFYLDFYNTRGQPTEIDIATDWNFNHFQTFPIQSTRIEQSFPADAVTGDSIRVSIRTRNSFSVSTIVSEIIMFDEIPPPVPPTPIVDWDDYREGTATFRYSVPDDTGGGSPIHQMEIQIGLSPGGDEITSEFGSASGTITVDLPTGATAYCRVRAYDLAGNIGEWSLPSQGVRSNGLPVVSSLAISPPVPTTSDDIASSFTFLDPDGDEIIETQFEWLLNGEVMSTTHTLPAALTVREQQWKLRLRGRDDQPPFGPWAEFSFTIHNSLPTLPFVKIVPTTPQPDEDIVADVQTYSTDGDGDEIGYQFKWFKSTDGGATFTEKLELRDAAQVNRNYLNTGELWEVHYIPYEVPPAGSTTPPIEGFAATDRVYVGENGLPEFQIHPPFGKTLATRDVLKDIRLNVYWNFSEPDGEECTVSLYWTDKLESGLVPVALDLPAKDYGFIGEIEIPADRPIYIHGIITDEKGAIVQRTTSAIREGEMGNGMIAY